MEPCPHCGGTTTSEESSALRWVCGACGGARIPGVQADRVTRANLARAKSEQTKRVASTAVGWGLAFMTLIVASLSLLAAASGHGGPAFGGAGLAAFDFALAVAAWAYARGRKLASREALDEAWLGAANTIARQHGGEITARDLAGILKLSEADADVILGKMSARGARVEIDDDARLHYRVEGEGPAAVGENAPSERRGAQR